MPIKSLAVFGAIQNEYGAKSKDFNVAVLSQACPCCTKEATAAAFVAAPAGDGKFPAGCTD